MAYEMIIEAGAVLIWGLCFGALVFSFAYGYHILRRIDQSAVETQTTETVTPPGK